MPQLWQATVGQVQVRLMAPALLHVLIMQSKMFPQLLVLDAMYLQASREEQLQQSAHLHAASFYWGTVVYCAALTLVVTPFKQLE